MASGGSWHRRPVEGPAGGEGVVPEPTVAALEAYFTGAPIPWSLAVPRRPPRPCITLPPLGSRPLPPFPPPQLRATPSGGSPSTPTTDRSRAPVSPSAQGGPSPHIGDRLSSVHNPRGVCLPNGFPGDTAISSAANPPPTQILEGPVWIFFRSHYFAFLFICFPADPAPDWKFCPGLCSQFKFLVKRHHGGLTPFLSKMRDLDPASPPVSPEGLADIRTVVERMPIPSSPAQATCHTTEVDSRQARGSTAAVLIRVCLSSSGL